MRAALISLLVLAGQHVFSQQPATSSFTMFKVKIDSLAESIDRNIGLLSVNRVNGKSSEYDFNAKVYYEKQTMSVYKVVYTILSPAATGKERTFHYYKGDLVKLLIGSEVYYLYDKKLMTGEGSVVSSSNLLELVRFEEEGRRTILTMM